MRGRNYDKGTTWNEIRKQTFVYCGRAKVTCIKVKLITRSECSETRPENNNSNEPLCAASVPETQAIIFRHLFVHKELAYHCHDAAITDP